MSTIINSHNQQNKDKIARTIAVLYDSKNNIPEYIRKMLIVRLVWATTEHDDQELSKKYQGQPYWTTGAIKQFLNNLAERSTNKRYNLFQDLRHEHAVPKKEIIARIQKSDKSKEAIFNILNNLGHAVIVSKTEDEELNKKGFRTKMPRALQDNSSIENVFSRYKEAGLKVCDIRNRDLKKLTLQSIIEIEKNALA